MIDELKIKVTAGRGGDGRVAFEKTPGAQGVTGGDGGNGGSVFIEGVSDLAILRNYRYKKEFQAENGGDGGVKRLKGKNGEDLVLKVPIGTVAHNLDTEEDFEIVELGEKIRLAKGGKGGRGNWQFRNAERRAPKFAEKGRSEESFDFHLELKMIADIGLVGLPSVGKSSLLNALTEAKVKVAAYHFTTLEPNLGIYYAKNKRQIILADIPGLIEGASRGKGLGDKFLRHIQRTRYIFHCLSAESEDFKKDYKTIRGELKSYDEDLAKKKEYLILTKTDLISDKEKKEKMKALKKISSESYSSSIEEKDGVNEVAALIEKIIEEGD